MVLRWNVWFVFAVVTNYWTCAKVLLDPDGGFKNVIIGINPEVAESKIENLLFELEVLFKNASKLLHTSTRGQTYFKEVVIALPKKYRNELANRHVTTDGRYFKNPDLIVTSRDAFTGPYAVQNSGCGKPGLRIHIPDDFMFDTIGGKERSLVQEWVKYRYGVFDESGFVGDELFPSCSTVPGSEEIRVTDCTDKEVQYEITKAKKSNSCNAIPVGDITHVTSSLMNKIDFQKANQFCDNEMYPHNKNAPSKQNALCREKSTWEVISQHQDFKQVRSSKRIPKEVSFKYVVEPEYRLILAADTSTQMAENDRLDMVRNAFSYFVLHNLPENAVVGVKNLKDKDRNPILVTVRSPSDADQLIDAFPEAYGEGMVCVHCGIQQALQNLKMSSAISQGEIIIISASDIEEIEVRSLENELIKNEVTLHVLYFKKRLKEPPLLKKLVKASGGTFFYIPDEPNSDQTVSSLTLIYEAFRSIYESSSWMNRNHALVDQATFLKETCSKCTISFKSDQSMESFQVLLTGPEFSTKAVIKEKTILSNGNQNFAPGHSSFSYKTKIPAYVFSIKEPKPGTWSLTFERKPNYYRPLVVIVRSSAPKHADLINMHPWINVEENEVTPKRPLITLYSEIKRGNLPILDVSIAASLYKPDTGENFDLEMFDGGDGDPDITKNDGIFSRYLANPLPSGYYIITMTAEKHSPQNHFGNSNQGLPLKAHKCCGSSIPTELMYDSGPFKRVATYGSFYLESTDMETKFPPRRIVNLRVEKVMILKSRLTYVLNWTAPGNNYDYGKAINYTMRVFKDRQSAFTSFDTDYVQTIDNFQVHGHILEPSDAGSLQSVIIELKNLTNGTYFLAMRTTNSEGQLSDTSNVIEVSHKGNLISPTSNPFTNDPNSSTETNPQDKNGTSSGFKIAIGVTCSFLFLFFVIGIFLIVYCAKARKSRKDKEAMRQNVISRYGGAPAFVEEDNRKTESCDALCDNNVMNISVISPVNSWPANSLLSHYETLQRNKNSDTSETSTVPKDMSDTNSVDSCKYSYVNRIDQNSSLYDPIYFPPNERENSNYPFNPSYVPFNPTYTSSLRKNREDGAFVAGYGPNSTHAYDYASESEVRQSPYASLHRYPNERMGNSFISNSTTLYGYEPDRGGRLGTDL